MLNAGTQFPQSMQNEEWERIYRVCRLILSEQDPARFTALVEALSELLQCKTESDSRSRKITSSPQA